MHPNSDEQIFVSSYCDKTLSELHTTESSRVRKEHLEEAKSAKLKEIREWVPAEKWESKRSPRFMIIIYYAVLTCLFLSWAASDAVVALNWYGWAGNVSHSSATLLLAIAPNVEENAEQGAQQILVTIGESSVSQTLHSKFSLVQERTLVASERILFAALKPNTQYFWRAEVDGKGTVVQGKFRTFPELRDTSRRMRIGFGSCAQNKPWFGKDAAAFRELANRDLDLFIHMGDLHYANIADDNRPAFDRAYWKRVFSRPDYASLLGGQAIAYVFDDHDYGANDADSSSPSRPAAIASYRDNVPHYPFNHSGTSPAIYQAFPVGPVYVIISDLVSESKEGGELVSQTQLDWLLEQLLVGHQNYNVTLWVSPEPWIGSSAPGENSWLGRPESRRLIANHIAKNCIDRLVLISGDAHALALDDGSNSDYSDSDVHACGAGMPVLESAPLWQTGKAKGGPHSHGQHAFRLEMNSHFGVAEIYSHDQSSVMCITLEGWITGENSPKMSHNVCGTFVKRGSGGDLSTPSISLFPAYVWVLLVSCLILAPLILLFLLKTSVRVKTALPFIRASDEELHEIFRKQRIYVASTAFFAFALYIGFLVIAVIEKRVPTSHLLIILLINTFLWTLLICVIQTVTIRMKILKRIPADSMVPPERAQQ